MRWRLHTGLRYLLVVMLVMASLRGLLCEDACSQCVHDSSTHIALRTGKDAPMAHCAAMAESVSLQSGCCRTAVRVQPAALPVSVFVAPDLSEQLGRTFVPPLRPIFAFHAPRLHDGPPPGMEPPLIVSMRV